MVAMFLLCCILIPAAVALSSDNEAQRWLSSQSESNELLVSLILREPSLDRRSTRREATRHPEKSTVRRAPLQVSQTSRKGIRLHAQGMLMFDDATLGQGENQTLLITATMTAMTGSVTAETVDTGNGATEVHAMDQPVTTNSSVNFYSVSAGYLNTGQGSNHLYPMDQDVRSTAQVAFQSVSIPTTLPDMQFTYYDQKALANYIHSISAAHLQSEAPVLAYTHGITADNYAYYGGVYSPTNNRIYLVPNAQGDNAEWHYIQPFTHSQVSISLMAGPLFNNF